MKTARRIYIVTVLLVAFDVALLMVPPLAAHWQFSELAQAVYQSYAGLCHQIPERSFSLFGIPLAVCQRCAAIHFGLLAGLALYPLLARRHSLRPLGRAPLLGAALLLALDTGLPWLTGYQNTPWSRVSTGLLAGGVLSFCLVPGFTNWISSPRTGAKPRTRDST
ncbi:MAG: DUF2085 domain-containing protein [Acidobacteria bacterium]|nr:DUF2085 domain-containing protein [Acidobacteriota bacterium]